MASCKYLNAQNVCTQTNTEPSKDVRFNTCLTSKQYDCTYYKGKSSSGCFITTAVCEILGKDDDCHELTSMRSFRDNWLKKQPSGEDEVQEYYAVAPQIVAAISSLGNADEIYSGICKNYIVPCVELTDKGDYPACHKIYRAMIESLRHKYVLEEV